MKLLDRIRSLFTRKKAVASPSQPSPLFPAVEHKFASPKIVKGYVRVTNDSDLPVVLAGGVIKQLEVKAHSYALVRSPILENVMRIKDFARGPNGERQVISEIAYINEWDALHVIDNMIEEYARGRAYDIMTPEELKVCTFPLPKRAMAELIEKISVKAQRENENISTQAR